MTFDTQRVRQIGVWLAALMFVFACGLPFSATTPEVLSQEQLNTLVARTALAARTQTAALLPPSATPTITRTPSLTPAPSQIQESATPTFFFAIPTLTPKTTETTIPTTAASSSSGSGKSTAKTASPIPTPSAWSCVVLERTFPTVKPKERFSLYVTFRNEGTRSWTGNTVDFVYTGGYRHEGTRIRDLSSTIAPGGTVTLTIEFVAPKNPGSYHAYWALRVGSNSFCGVRVTFDVIGK
jgi:hypothetical protein